MPFQQFGGEQTELFPRMEKNAQEGKIHRLKQRHIFFYNKAVPKKRRKRSLFTEWERPVGEHAAKQFKEENP